MKYIKSNYVYLFVIIILFALIFRNFFTFYPLSSGDWNIRYSESFEYYSFLPQIWSINFGGGMGGSVPYILGLDAYYFITGKFFSLFFPWVIIERVLWFIPYIFLSLLSSYLLVRKSLGEQYAIVAPLIYSINTYSILLVAGGQMGVALAYGIAPLVLYLLIRFVNTFSVKNKSSIIISGFFYGLVFSFQIILDPRISYITVVASLVLILKEFIPSNHKMRFIYFVFPGFVIFCLNLFWLLPLFFYPQSINQLGEQYTSSASLAFFSFAGMENTISLLHPNWPENLFGKVSFLNPIFLSLPLIAFSSLLFVNKEDKSRNILVTFLLIGLLGIFLGKGVNQPFGEVYRFLFDNFPGFVMFRDPTKWYLLIALSYAVTIPYSIVAIHKIVKKNFGDKTGFFVHLVFIFLLLFMIKEALQNNIGGTLQSRTIPKEFTELKDKIIEEEGFYRTLWIPRKQRYAYHGFDKPAVGADELLKNTDINKIFEELNGNSKFLSESSFKYIVVPSDPLGEIFLEDRRYSNSLREQYIDVLDNITWLEKKDFDGKTAIYEIDDSKNHFWITNKGSSVNSRFISPTKYMVEVVKAKKGDRIVFTDRYDAFWFAKPSSSEFEYSSVIRSSPYQGKVNSFVIREEGSYDLEIFYLPQRYVEVGLYTGYFVIATTALALIYMYKRRK